MPKYLVTRYWNISDWCEVEADSEEEALRVAATDDNFIEEYEPVFVSEEARLLTEEDF